MEREGISATDTFDASVTRGGGAEETIRLIGRYEVQCIGPNGELKWEDVIDNTVVTVGKNDVLDKYLGLAAPASIFCGLISGTGFSAIAAADTMSSHAGWLEAGNANDPDYTAPRKTPSFSAASGGVKSTSAVMAFAMLNTGTVKGAFMVVGGSSTIDNTTGTLLSAGLFSGGDKSVGNGDTLNVSWSLTLT